MSLALGQLLIHQDMSWINPFPLSTGISGHGICSHSKMGISRNSLGCHCCRISLWEAGRQIPGYFRKALSQMHPSFCSLILLPHLSRVRIPESQRLLWWKREKKEQIWAIPARDARRVIPSSLLLSHPPFPFPSCSFPSPQPQLQLQAERDTLHVENTFRASARLLGSCTNANAGSRCLSRGTEYKSARLVPAPGRPQLEYAV